MNKCLKIEITHTRRGSGEKIALEPGTKVFFTEKFYKEEKTCGVSRKIFVLKPNTENELKFLTLAKFEKGKKRYYLSLRGVKYFFESFDPFKAVLPPERTQKKKSVKK